MLDPMDRPTPDDLADLAHRAAERAAHLLRGRSDGEITVAATKSSPTDLVTESDRATEAAIVAEVLGARPDDAVLAEEGNSRPGTSGVTWIIDPIDGTTNFVYSLPGYNVSIAAAIGDQVVAGVVVDPIRGDTYRATLGGGATCNGVRMRVRDATDLGHALVGTGFSYDPQRRREQAAVVARIMGDIRDIRRLGAAALDLCHVAAGRLDAYFETGLQPWDLAAGALIAAEAGALVTGLDAGHADGAMTIAGTPVISGALRDLLVTARSEGLAVEDPSARDGREFGRLGVWEPASSPSKTTNASERR